MYPCANNRNNALTNISNSKPSQPFFHFNSSGYTQGLQLFILLEPSYTIDQCSSLFSISPSELQECCLFNTTLEHRLFGGSLLFIFLLFCIVLYFVFLVFVLCLVYPMLLRLWIVHAWLPNTQSVFSSDYFRKYLICYIMAVGGGNRSSQRKIMWIDNTLRTCSDAIRTSRP